MTGRSAPKGASLLGVYNRNRPECSILPAAFVAAYLVHGAVGIPLQAALVFGVLIAATDPISVLALFKEMGAPKRLGVIIEGESLFNDGTAVVLTLPEDFPARETVPAMTFGVVAFSIVVQGLTVQPLMRKLGIKMGEEDEYDHIKVRRMALTVGLEDLEKLHDEHLI